MKRSSDNPTGLPGLKAQRVEGDQTQELFDAGTLPVAAPPMYWATAPAADIPDLPGYIHRDQLKRDEQGQLLKSYLRYQGFAAPIIAGYNQTILKIRTYLIETFRLVLEDQSVMRIVDVRFFRPVRNGDPLFPNVAESEKLSYMVELRVQTQRTQQATGGQLATTETSTDFIFFGHYFAMTGSIMCNLSPQNLLPYVRSLQSATDPMFTDLEQYLL